MITGVRSLSTGVRSFRCVVGADSVDVRNRGIAFIDDVASVGDDVERILATPEESPGCQIYLPN